MIEVEQVSHSYGSHRAVSDVSFSIGAGEIVGFLGPNGAGKSTLLRALSTYLEPTSGTIRIAGHDVRRDPLGARSQLGYLTEHNALYEAMRVDRMLEFAGRAQGLSVAQTRERIEWLVERCGIADVQKKRVRECSKGYRQRVGLAASLLHDPPVLLLDEPTHGLDPVQVGALREFLHELKDGRAILFSSHILAEVAAICDRVLILQQGKLLCDARLSELEERATSSGRSLEAVVLAIIAGQGQAAEAQA